jgi:hypothetical protein
VLTLRVASTSLPFSGFVFAFEKSLDRQSERAIECAQTREWNVKKPVLASSLHQLGNMPAMIHVHYDEQTGLGGQAHGLAGIRDLPRKTIRFNHDAGNGGTHSTPQQK